MEEFTPDLSLLYEMRRKTILKIKVGAFTMEAEGMATDVVGVGVEETLKIETRPVGTTEATHREAGLLAMTLLIRSPPEC